MGQPLLNTLSGIRGQNPMLMPNFDPIVTYPGAAPGSIGSQPPDVFLQTFPRTASTTPGQITVGGTVGTGDVATIIFSNNVFPAPGTVEALTPVSVSYTLTGTDTVSTVAGFLAAAINSNTTLQRFGFYATADEAAGVVNIFQQSAVGDFTTLTTSVTGSLTLTVNTQIAGGSGPIIPAYSFEFDFGTYNVTNFYIGRPVDLGYSQIKQLVDAGYPIY
jgi:hypothetical protein